MTRRQLAGITGIPKRYISEMESGKRQIGRELAKMIATKRKIRFKANDG